jgi:beta-alanine degradation protein BauB
MKKLVATIALTLTLLTSLFAQDVMQTGVKHIKVLAEDDKVRVLHFTPSKGDKTPVHSHPETVLYVIKGGKIRTTLADGTSAVAELKAGQTTLRPPVTHSDEALDDIDAIIIELKK